MSESKIEPEAQPSTSQSADSQKTTIFPLVSMPKVVLTRLDLGNLPIPVFTSPSPIKKPVKRLTVKKNKPLTSKPIPNKPVTNVKHATRFRGKPKKDYKFLSDFGKSPVELTKSKTPTGKVGGIVKKVPKLTAQPEDNSVKGMLKKTMLQKRSKIAIPPAKKPKLTPKPAKASALTPKPKNEKTNAVTPAPKKDVSPKIKDDTFKGKSMDTDASEDEFLYDELIDELVNHRNKKVSVTEKTTNITLKPNMGNKPPTIVKGGIIKKSSLPPDLKSVASPSTLNSSKLTGTALNFKYKPVAVENIIKTPATAETPKASLPLKASPFPIAINSSPSKAGSKDLVKKGQKRPAKTTSVVKEDPPLNLNTPKSSSKPTKVPQKPKSVGGPTAPISRPRGRPKIGPKQVIAAFPALNAAAEDDSDEYTEVETLENIDSEPIELLSTNQNDDIQEITQTNSSVAIESRQAKEDEDPHLDLLRILTDETEDAVPSEPSDLKEVSSETPHNNPVETPKTNLISTPVSSNNSDLHTSEKTDNPDIESAGDREADKPLVPETQELSTAPVSEDISDNANDIELPSEEVVEETPPVRTIYDLIREVSLQYPSWNLHIIPETNAFCIAQVTKGRLGLPTLKKCIELDPDTYSAKVYIHQYHIKRFDGVYDSEEAILALIEEIHSIKA